MLTRGQIKKYNGIRYIFYDFETSGLNPYNDDIIEIGAIDNLGNKFNVLIDINKKLSQKVVELTGITDNLLKKKGINFEDAIYQFKSFLDLHYNDNNLYSINKVYMIAHNNDAFDKIFLNFSFKKLGLDINNINFIDSYRLAQLVLPQNKYFSLKSLSKYFGIDLVQDHRALGDCEMLKQVFYILLTFI